MPAGDPSHVQRTSVSTLPLSGARSWRDASSDRPTAIALGNFDGVHLGHRRILDALRAHAERDGLQPVALTFEPHPRQFLFPDARTSLLTSPRDKAALIEAQGVAVITLTFDADLAALSAEEFATEVLMTRLRGRHFFLGDDHRFGKGARGDAGLLKSLGARTGLGPTCVTTIPPAHEGNELVSSSTIRHHLHHGRITRAGELLGRPYTLSGTVVPGAARGRLLGFPTANLRPDDPRSILPFGVFGGYARLADDSKHSAVANIGLRPTFHDAPPEPSVEIHLLDWTGDLYGQPLTFEFRHFVRPERKFKGIDSLKAQITEDVGVWKKASGV